MEFNYLKSSINNQYSNIDLSSQTNECAQCKRVIFTQFEIYLEFCDFFYHKDCFKCKSCPKEFSFAPTESSRDISIPILDKTGSLYCPQDFIRTLECKICLNKFEPSSAIFKLQDTDRREEEILVHSECVNCNSCKSKIDISSEYVLTRVQLEEDIFLNCKACVKELSKGNGQKSKKSKCIKSVNHRLSSRQKERLAGKILTNNIDVEHLMKSAKNDQNGLLENLAMEIKCSKKSLFNYLNKHLSKNKEVEESKLIEANKANSIKQMLDDLKQLDKVLAPPNKCPFSSQIRTKSSNLGLDVSNVFADLTSTILNVQN